MSTTDTPVTERNLTAVRRLCRDVFGSGDLPAIDEVVAESYVNHNAPPGMPPGREGLRGVVSMVRGAMPDFSYTIEDEVAVGDTVVVRVTASGTHSGPLLGLPPTGRTATWSEAHFFRCSEGVAVEHWGVRDDLAMLQQLGVVPALGGHLQPHSE